MKAVHTYFSYIHRFMVDVDIRHGASFHFVPFFLTTVLLPLNLVCMALLDMDDFVLAMLSEMIIGMIAGLITSFIPGFGRWLNQQFYTYSHSRKKRGFVEQARGYGLVLGMQVSPIILVLMRMLCCDR